MNGQTRNRLFAAIAAALPLVAVSLPAGAQTRVNQDGRAHDANNRVGSDGSNDSNNGIDRRGQTFTGNQLITGNVSGARAFRGPVGYRDSNEFRGPISGLSSDRLNRDGGGGLTRSSPFQGGPTAYYGSALSTPAPANFRPEGFTGTYYSTGVGQQTTGYESPYFQSASNIYTNQTSMLRPAGLLSQSPVDGQNNSTMLSTSPLYGMQPLTTGPVGDVNDTARNEALGARNPANRFRLNNSELQRMRDELNKTGEMEAGSEEAAAAEGSSLNSALQSEPLDSSLQSGRVDQQGATNAADRAGTNQGMSRNLVVPAKQSKLYAELQERMRRRQSENPTPEEQNRDFRKLKKALDAEAAGTGTPGEPGRGKPAEGERKRPALPPTRQEAPAAAPGAPAAAQSTPEAAPMPLARPAAEPLKVKSLAEGVEAKGLKDLLTNAEQLMKEGKFTSAIEKYGNAEQVAPNNPLIRLGRAQAELGATRYGSAEQHLREAFTADPALLMGQYDLDAFIGRERLAFVISDLKKVAESEVGSARPKLLLAYIAFNTPGLESAAADYLSEAEKRAGRPDPLINAMRQHWALPEAGAPAPEANK